MDRDELKERARTVSSVVDATRLALQGAPIEGTAYNGRHIMRGLTIDEIRLKIEDMGHVYTEQEVARAVEELVARGEVNLVHTENRNPSYQWWPPADAEVA